MFLIAKIVRGRRLLHELEQQEKDEAAAALEAAHSISQVSRRLVSRQQRASHDAADGSNEETSSTAKTERKKSARRKTHACGSIDSSLDANDRLTVRRTSSMPSLCEAITGLSAAPSSTVKHYNYEDKLNRMQRRALRFTWHRLQTRNGGKRVENVFEEVYDRLVRAMPSVRDIFTTRMFLSAMSRNETASLRDHAKFTVKMFDLVLKNMDLEPTKRTDTGSSLDPRILGQGHGLLRPYGLTGQYWEKLGEVIIDVVLGQEAVRDLPGAGQAWVIFTACLVDQLRAGFEESRGTCQLFPKREAVLHHATKHLYDVDLQEPSCSNAVDTSVVSATVPSTSSESKVTTESTSSKQCASEKPRVHRLSRQHSMIQGKRRPSKTCERRCSVEGSGTKFAISGHHIGMQPLDTIASTKDEDLISKDTTNAPQETTTPTRRRQSNVDGPPPPTSGK